MQRFTIIEDACALVRYPKGIHKIVNIYHRGVFVYIPHAGGFVRVCSRFDGRYSTGHPDLKVHELEGPNGEPWASERHTKHGEPVYLERPPRVRSVK